ncbi:26164_t:CDS:2, partial [Dentiscutata erythropus]
ERPSQLSMTPASGDGGRDIIEEMHGYRFVIQCKAWYKKCIGREEIDTFLTEVQRGKFDFGILVGALEKR